MSPLAATEQSIAQRFEQIVQRHPDRVALETTTGRVTYRQLDRAANRIAHAVLDRRGEGAEPVAVLMDRDLPSIASIIALARAGKIYVPLEPSFPARRLADLLANCRPGLLLASRRHEELARMASGNLCGVLDVETLDGRAEQVELPLSPDTLAYIIYTSGSTGRPKGVAHSHFGMLHQVQRHTNALKISADDRIAMLGSAGAAQANTQLWVALLNGATLFPRDLRQEGLANLAAWLSHHGMTYFRSSASLFRHWAAHLTERSCPTLRLIAIGGEPVYRADVELYRERFHRGCLLVNALSSTETGTVCMHVLDQTASIDGDVVPVGNPLDDVEVFLVDEAGAEVPAGEIGEIMVRSRGLAIGYWTHDGLDRQDFPPDPRDPRLHTFRMGDLGARAADGVLLELGRKDTLVKVSGHRVDVGEIELALRESGQVRQVAVIDRDDDQGEKQLVACIVPGSERPPDRTALRRFLQERLPAHMLPSHVEFLARLPLTASGKIDRPALRALAVALPPRMDASGGRLSLLGVQLAGIWEDLLGMTGIGPDDDFMDLGGGSLLAMDMLLRVERACGRRLLPSQLLGGPLTIARLVDLLMTDEHASFGQPLVAVQPEGSRPPLFFLHGDHENGGLYCHGLARRLGADQPFYAVTPHGLDGDALPWSIEDMARERLEAIRAMQARGPYRLGGFCTGGLIAFEIARQLEAQNEKVETLLLIDAALDNAPLAFRLSGQAMRLLAAVLRWDEDTRRRRFLRLREALTHYRASVRSGRWGRTRHVIAKLRARRGRSGESSPGETPPHAPSPFDGHIAQHQAYAMRRRDYLPGRIGGRIALFRSDYLGDQPPAAGWGGFASHVDEQALGASHQETLTRHIDLVAEWMKPHLGGGNPATFASRLLPGWPAGPQPEPYVVGVLPGEGIGPEVIGVTLRLLEAIGEGTGRRFEVRQGGKIGLDAQRESGRVLTREVMDFCHEIFAARGAILCGPGGGRFVYELRAAFDLFCKLVPLKPMPALRNTGVLVPEALRDVDILIVRENASGVYFGDSGVDASNGRNRAWHRFHYDQDQVDRLLRLAVRAAQLRRGRLCVVIKPAGVPDISEMWRERAVRLASDSGIELRILEVDTACYQIVAEARSFDVVAAPNMFGDVLADGASVLLGARGMSYSANYSEHGYAVYQTGHGAAHDLAGTDRGNPVGQIQSLAMMLRESFGRPDLADALAGAVSDTLEAGWRTPDIMGPGCTRVRTRELGERIEAALAARLSVHAGDMQAPKLSSPLTPAWQIRARD